MAAFADELLSGYDVDLEALLRDGASPAPAAAAGIVAVTGIAVSTVCPHHLLPALGEAQVAYAPGSTVLGLGTVARLLDAFARRLTLQEGIGHHVVTTLMSRAGARGAYCRIELTHGCLSARGACQASARAVTVSSAGSFQDATGTRLARARAPRRDARERGAMNAVEGERRFAIVTGASRGVGRATALALARRGLAIGLVGRGVERARADALARARERRARRCAPGSSTSPDLTETEAAARRIASEVNVEVLVNNAGVAHRTRIEETSTESYEEQLAVNLSAPFLLTRELLPAMRRRARGRIVHVGSISSTLGSPRLAAYCASKWGLVGFMKSLAEELHDSGVMTLAILPGSIDTRMLQGSGFPRA